jgi:hypothetical protein
MYFGMATGQVHFRQALLAQGFQLQRIVLFCRAKTQRIRGYAFTDRYDSDA